MVGCRMARIKPAPIEQTFCHKGQAGNRERSRWLHWEISVGLETSIGTMGARASRHCKTGKDARPSRVKIRKEET